MNEEIEKIARAVLYEGYMLYPYRASALKNRQRWNFGVLFPDSYDGVKAKSERSSIQTECLVLGSDETAVEVSIRFLLLSSNENAEAMNQPAPGESEFRAPATKVAWLVDAPVSIAFKKMSDQNAIKVVLDIHATRVAEGTFRLSVKVRNVTPLEKPNIARDDALIPSLLSTHIVLHVIGGEFISLMDPPLEYREAAESCHQGGLWPVLVGEEGQRDWMLAAPIILYDYPQVAAESAGDMFDGTEIDEILTLRVLTLTDEEKKQIRAEDARARELLERSELLPAEHLMKLHGVMRGLNGRTAKR